MHMVQVLLALHIRKKAVFQLVVSASLRCAVVLTRQLQKTRSTCCQLAPASMAYTARHHVENISSVTRVVLRSQIQEAINRSNRSASRTASCLI